MSVQVNGEILQQLVCEAVREVLKKVEVLPEAVLSSCSQSLPIETISRHVAQKVTEGLIAPRIKVPCYKPTPIALLQKQRRLPIRYCPASGLARKRRSPDDYGHGNIHKRAKMYVDDDDDADDDDDDDDDDPVSSGKKEDATKSSSECQYNQSYRCSPVPLAAWSGAAVPYTINPLSTASFHPGQDTNHGGGVRGDNDRKVLSQVNGLEGRKETDYGCKKDGRKEKYRGKMDKGGSTHRKENTTKGQSKADKHRHKRKHEDENSVEEKRSRYDRDKKDRRKQNDSKRSHGSHNRAKIREHTHSRHKERRGKDGRDGRHRNVRSGDDGDEGHHTRRNTEGGQDENVVVVNEDDWVDVSDDLGGEEEEEEEEEVTCILGETLSNEAVFPSDVEISNEEVSKECLRIFNEYRPVDDAKAKTIAGTVQESAPRKRIAHTGSTSCISVKIKSMDRRRRATNAKQMLLERLEKQREAVAAQEDHVNGTTVTLTNSVNHSKSAGRVRIAHVPNVSLILRSKMKLQQQLEQYRLAKESPVAAVAPCTLPSRPVLSDAGGRIPTSVRQKYLDMMVDEYLKRCLPAEEARDRAVECEQNVHVRSRTRTVYVNLMCNAVNQLRKRADDDGEDDDLRKAESGVTFRTSLLFGKRGIKGSWSIEKAKYPTELLTNGNIYDEFHRFILSEEELKCNGFPHPHSEQKGMAVVYAQYKKPFLPLDTMQRICARCSCTYFVNKQGMALKEKDCVYHWGSVRQSHVRGMVEATYACCQGGIDSNGCTVAAAHVSDTFDPNCMRGFVKTLPKCNAAADHDYGVYALDCEMCYTTVGLELSRVSVVDARLRTVYETLVRPSNPIIDYNSRFSGIDEDDLRDVKTSIYEVQSALLSIINDKTIVVGHSVESDLKALRLVHFTVVDTSVVFPHREGPPKKRALKSLCREFLQKIIQEGSAGHDSAEDAKACMELMLYRIKEDV